MSRYDSPRPRDAAKLSTLDACEQPGYYPKFHVLDQQSAWDAKTREVVLARVESPPPRRFFDEATYEFWECVFEHIMPQSDRIAERRIPITARIDERLAAHRTVGYRYTDMPHDEQAYAWGREAIDAEAMATFHQSFCALAYHQREQILCRLHDGQPQAAPDIWQRMSVHRFWILLLNDAAEAYYAHPWAWDEIGFGGPAYPRGYMRLENGQPEPWETSEIRYNWLPPADSLSGTFSDVSDIHVESDQHRSFQQRQA